MRSRKIGHLVSFLLVLGQVGAAAERECDESRYLDVASVASGRLTLTTVTPVTTGNVTAATVIYYTPYLGSKISLYDGSNWKLYNFSELSLALGTLTSATNYDVFMYANSGVPALDSPVAWTDATNRATAIVLQDGVYVKSGQTTRRYLGTFRTTSTTTTEDSLQNRFLFNVQNRASRQIYYAPGGGSYSYSTPTWRSAANNNAHRIGAVFGVAGSTIDLALNAHTNAAGASLASTSICFECTNNYDQAWGEVQAAGYFSLNSRAVWTPTAGYHWFQLVEYASGVISFYGSYTFVNGTINN